MTCSETSQTLVHQFYFFWIESP